MAGWIHLDTSNIISAIGYCVGILLLFSDMDDIVSAGFNTAPGKATCYCGVFVYS